jgi:hypothetical protein
MWFRQGWIASLLIHNNSCNFIMSLAMTVKDVDSVSKRTQSVLLMRCPKGRSRPLHSYYIAMTASPQGQRHLNHEIHERHENNTTQDPRTRRMIPNIFSCHFVYFVDYYVLDLDRYHDERM